MTWLDRDLTEKGWHNYHSLGHAYEPDTHPTHDFETCTAPACVWARGEMEVKGSSPGRCPSSFTDREMGHVLVTCDGFFDHDGPHTNGGFRYVWTDARTKPYPQADPSNTASPVANPESRETDENPYVLSEQPELYIAFGTAYKMGYDAASGSSDSPVTPSSDDGVDDGIDTDLLRRKVAALALEVPAEVYTDIGSDFMRLLNAYDQLRSIEAAVRNLMDSEGLTEQDLRTRCLITHFPDGRTVLTLDGVPRLEWQEASQDGAP